MSRSLVVIGYSPAQARRRSVAVPDDDSEVPGLVALFRKMGEATVVVSLGLYRLIGPDAALQQVLGRAPVKDRCALVDAGGVVRGFVGADPGIDRLPVHIDGHPHTLRYDPDGTLQVGQGVHR
jgi:hypothetical protein